MAKKLREWQQELSDQEESNPDIATTFLHFSDQLGRLAHAIRDQRGLYAEAGRAENASLENAFGQTMRQFIALANQSDIDLETAFRKKDAVNAGRKWKSKP